MLKLADSTDRISFNWMYLHRDWPPLCRRATIVSWNSIFFHAGIRSRKYRKDIDGCNSITRWRYSQCICTATNFLVNSFWIVRIFWVLTSQKKHCDCNRGEMEARRFIISETASRWSYHFEVTPLVRIRSTSSTSSKILEWVSALATLYTVTGSQHHGLPLMLMTELICFYSGWAWFKHALVSMLNSPHSSKKWKENHQVLEK